jgi:hypothetical protein
MGKQYGLSKWSWKRAFGFSGSKMKLSKMIGIPLTKEGRNRKIGREMSGCLINLTCLNIIIFIFFLLVLCGMIGI